MTRLFTFVWLILVWMALWESITLANLIAGAVAAAVATMLVPFRFNKSGRVRPIAAVKLAGYFVWKLLEASVQVAWEIATPKDGTAPAVIHVPLQTNAPGIITAVANMVSLTPGTLTLEVDSSRPALFIHVLHFESSEQTTSEVRRLEQLTVEAFPTASGRTSA